MRTREITITNHSGSRQVTETLFETHVTNAGHGRVMIWAETMQQALERRARISACNHSAVQIWEAK